ncbi:hypothetical protein ACIP3A_00175 [Streptomyces tricolor]
MSRDEGRADRGNDLEKDRARHGLLAVVVSNRAIAAVAVSACGGSTGTTR